MHFMINGADMPGRYTMYPSQILVYKREYVSMISMDVVNVVQVVRISDFVTNPRGDIQKPRHKNHAQLDNDMSYGIFVLVNYTLAETIIIGAAIVQPTDLCHN